MKIHTAKKQAFYRFLSLFLAAAITLNVMSMSALSGVSAEEADIPYGEDEPFQKLPDSEELESMYIDQLFYGEGVSFYKDYGRTALDGVRLEIYEALRTEIEKIAAGENTATLFTVKLSKEQIDSDISGADLSLINQCLMADLPQNFYWYDKTKGCTIGILTYSDGSQDYEFGFAVSENYADKSAGMTEGKYYTVDPAKINSAKKAAENARKIAAEYDEKSDYEKIMGYKNMICNLTEYNDDAAKNDDFPYGDPWQLVYVFDDDPTTNVVCEGYAKAFQYLCDLGGIECYTVTGDLAGGTGAGPHMWNVLVLDGKSYIADITNCDGDSAGSPDRLLLKGAEQSDANGCEFNIGQKLTYTYDNEAKSLYPEEILTVSNEDYDPNSAEPEPEPITDHNNHTICADCENCPNHTEHTEIEWKPWTSTDSLPSDAGNYYLAVNVTLTHGWEPADGTNLCLNGNRITVHDTTDHYGVHITENAAFNLCDCRGKGKITKKSQSGIYSIINNCGSFNMYSGEINGIASETKYTYRGVDNSGKFCMCGGKISENSSIGIDNANSGVFYMYGGEISNNYGRGVINDLNSTFYMYGGKISNNGGGVINNGLINGENNESDSDKSGRFYMYGGEITANTIDSPYTSTLSNKCGGGVWNGGIFELRDGIIYNNNAGAEGGGGVFNTFASKFDMYGGKISGNTAVGAGGGVKIDECLGVPKDMATFTMHGGEISGNTTEDSGGGVYNFFIFNMLGGLIKDNTAKNSGGGIYAFGLENRELGTLNLCGGTVTENTAYQYSGIYTSGGPVTVGGEFIVNNNKCGDEQSNLYIDDSIMKITIDPDNPLSGNASIGIRTKDKPSKYSRVNVSYGNSTDFTEFFHSDNPAYEIINGENNVVQLALPHVHIFKHIEANAPECEKEGNEECYICEECYKIFDTDKVTELDDIPYIEALGHEWGEWTITAEPAEEPDSIGEAERVCGRDSSHVEKVVLKTLIGEMWEKILEKPATCVEEGERVYENEYGIVRVLLQRLSHEYEEEWQKNEEKHWQVCKNCGTVNPDSEHPHSWDEGVITVEATVGHEGEITYTCEVCGYTRTEIMPKLDPPVTLPPEPETTTTTPTPEPETTTTTPEPETTTTTPEPETTTTTPEPETTTTTPEPETTTTTPEPETTTTTPEPEAATTPPETEPPVTPPTETEPPVTVIRYDDFIAPPTCTTEQAAPETVTSTTETTTVPPETTEPVQVAPGSVTKRLQSSDYTAELLDGIGYLADNLLTDSDKALISQGSNAEILLTVDKLYSVSQTVSESVRESLDGFRPWQYFDINLYKIIDGTSLKLTSVGSPITIRLAVPEALRIESGEYAMIRVHEGKAELMEDLDGSEDTVTFKTDRFSVYALVFRDKPVNKDAPMNTGADSYTSVLIACGASALSVATGFGLMGAGIVGMSPESKNRLYDKLIRWGKGGGRFRRTTALALIFLLLSYYYGMGFFRDEKSEVSAG